MRQDIHALWQRDETELVTEELRNATNANTEDVAFYS